MKLNIYSIFDKAAQAFITPFFMHNKAMAIRVFSDNVNSQEENNISKHPEQFSLFHLGEYDDSTGVIIPLEKPEVVATALEVKEFTEEQDLLKEIRLLKSLLITLQEDK